MKGTLLVVSSIIALAILLFNGTFGYFILTASHGIPKGIYLFIGLSVVAVILSLVPILLKYTGYRFYFGVLLYTNIVVAFYPLFYKVMANYVVANLLSSK